MHGFGICGRQKSILISIPTIDEYAKKAIATLIGTHEYGEVDARLMAQVLGLVGESGEVAEKFKKLVRDKQGILTDDDRTEILKELGDVLWYVNAVAHLLGSSLEGVAQMNNQKLASRQARQQLHGQGDNR